MTNFETEKYSEAELVAEFERLFPQGFAGPDVLKELAPEGWKASPAVKQLKRNYSSKQVV